MKSIIEIKDGVLEKCTLSPGETSITLPAGAKIESRSCNTHLPTNICLRDLEENQVRMALAIDDGVRSIALRETGSRRAFIAWVIGRSSQAAGHDLTQCLSILACIDTFIDTYQPGSLLANSEEERGSRKPRCNLS